MTRRAILVCLLALASVRAARADAPLVVVVAKGSPVKSISRAQLKQCFLSEPTTVEDRPLVPFNASPGSPDRVRFDREILGMTPEQVGRYWVDRKVRGEAGAPRSLPSDTHIMKVVAKFPNAIGYIPVDRVTPELQPVAIDGVPYSDPRYPLQDKR